LFDGLVSCLRTYSFQCKLLPKSPLFLGGDLVPGWSPPQTDRTLALTRAAAPGYQDGRTVSRKADSVGPRDVQPKAQHLLASGHLPEFYVTMIGDAYQCFAVWRKSERFDPREMSP